MTVYFLEDVLRYLRQAYNKQPDKIPYEITTNEPIFYFQGIPEEQEEGQLKGERIDYNERFNFDGGQGRAGFGRFGKGRYKYAVKVQM